MRRALILAFYGSSVIKRRKHSDFHWTRVGLLGLLLLLALLSLGASYPPRDEIVGAALRPNARRRRVFRLPARASICSAYDADNIDGREMGPDKKKQWTAELVEREQQRVQRTAERIRCVCEGAAS